MVLDSNGALGEDFCAVWLASIKVAVDRHSHVQVTHRFERGFSGAVICRAGNENVTLSGLL